MKIHLKFILMSIIVLTGCNVDNPCKNANAVCPDSYESTFRIISKTDGRDLVFGASGIFDKSKIKMFSINGSDTVFANYKPSRLVMTGYDSVLHFTFPSKRDTIFIKLSDTDIDTIKATYGLTQGRCCSFNSITVLSYNNGNPIFNSVGTVEFRK